MRILSSRLVGLPAGLIAGLLLVLTFARVISWELVLNRGQRSPAGSGIYSVVCFKPDATTPGA